MFDLTKLISEEEARAVYADKGLLNSLSEDEQRVALQSLYFYDEELFAHEITDRWVKDQATSEEIDTPEFHREIWKEDKKKHDILLIVARDHAKSTAESKIKTLMRVGRLPRNCSPFDSDCNSVPFKSCK